MECRQHSKQLLSGHFGCDFRWNLVHWLIGPAGNEYEDSPVNQLMLLPMGIIQIGSA